MYAWWMDRLNHRSYKRGRSRELLMHCLPKEAYFGDTMTPEKSVFSGRCVCHLMKLQPGETVVAWPYRARFGSYGYSWYHPSAEGVSVEARS